MYGIHKNLLLPWRTISGSGVVTYSLSGWNEEQRCWVYSMEEK